MREENRKYKGKNQIVKGSQVNEGKPFKSNKQKEQTKKKGIKHIVIKNLIREKKEK